MVRFMPLTMPQPEPLPLLAFYYRPVEEAEAIPDEAAITESKKLRRPD